MVLDRNGLARLREFMVVVDRVMNELPRPVPPALLGDWDGPLLPVQAFYLAYSRLPAALQEITARGYQRCERALASQHDTAVLARIACYQLFSDIMRQTGLSPEQLVSDRYERGHLTLVPDVDPGDAEEDDDEALRREVLQIAASHEPIPFPSLVPAAESDAATAEDEPVACSPAVALAPDDGADVRARPRAAWFVALGAFVAGAVAVSVVDAPSPRSSRAPDAAPAAMCGAAPAAAIAIDRSARADDMTVIVSHAVRTDEHDVDLHVHMVNAGESSREADITVHAGDHDTPVPPPEVIPPRSTRHRVIKIRDERRDRRISVTVGGATVHDLDLPVPERRR